MYNHLFKVGIHNIYTYINISIRYVHLLIDVSVHFRNHYLNKLINFNIFLFKFNYVVYILILFQIEFNFNFLEIISLLLLIFNYI